MATTEPLLGCSGVPHKIPIYKEKKEKRKTVNSRRSLNMQEGDAKSSSTINKELALQIIQQSGDIQLGGIQDIRSSAIIQMKLIIYCWCVEGSRQRSSCPHMTMHSTVHSKFRSSYIHMAMHKSKRQPRRYQVSASQYNGLSMKLYM